MGRSSQALLRRRVSGDTRGQAPASTRTQGTSLVGSNPVPLIAENRVAEGVCSAVVQFSAKDLARITGKSVEAAKSWKSGDRTPNSAQLINLARQIPAVKKWLLREIEFESDEFLTTWAADVQRRIQP
jgi:hypothetical protein